MITPYDILHHELIGLEAEVVGPTHRGYACKGKIIDETKNTIKIKTDKSEKIIPKDCVTIDVKLPKNTVVQINGKLIIGRPEERIKKRYRIRF